MARWDAQLSALLIRGCARGNGCGAPLPHVVPERPISYEVLCLAPCASDVESECVVVVAVVVPAALAFRGAYEAFL